MLARTIESIRDDPAELRNAIYELARIKLQRVMWQRTPPLSTLEGRRLMLELETAIERVETVSSQQDQVRLLESPVTFAQQTRPETKELQGRGPTLILEQAPPIFADDFARITYSRAAPRQQRRTLPNRIVRSAGVVLLASVGTIVALVSFVLVDRQLDLAGRRPQLPDNALTLDQRLELVGPTPAAAKRTSSLGFQLPEVYGIYALSNGELHELKALPGRVPDQRVFMSAAISTPSQTIVDNGHVAFVVYRRDIATSAPERVQVRVIAKITRAMTFDAGRANTVAVDDHWTIRGNAYDLRVSPVADNSEMLMVRPENSEFELPAGRYGLVIKGLAYDFTVEGPITDPAHCLERVEAANGSFYSECGKS